MKEFPLARHQKLLNNPYLLCFAYCAMDICLGSPASEEVSLVVDQNGEFWHRASEYVNEVTGWPEVGGGKMSVRFASREDEILLQAADLIAYELMKHLYNPIFHPTLAERKSFLALKHMVDPNAKRYDIFALRQLFRDLESRNVR